MRVLTVRQPWAWAIIHGGKNIENRARNLAGSYRGPVVIHAAKEYAADTFAPGGAKDRIQAAGVQWPNGHTMETGTIIGIVDLVDVHPYASDGDWYCACSTWAEPGSVHLELANPRPLQTPLPHTGGLGMRTLTTNLISQIEAQLPQ